MIINNCQATATIVWAVQNPVVRRLITAYSANSVKFISRLHWNIVINWTVCIEWIIVFWGFKSRWKALLLIGKNVTSCWIEHDTVLSIWKHAKAIIQQAKLMKSRWLIGNEIIGLTYLCLKLEQPSNYTKGLTLVQFSTARDGIYIQRFHPYPILIAYGVARQATFCRHLFSLMVAGIYFFQYAFLRNFVTFCRSVTL